MILGVLRVFCRVTAKSKIRGRLVSVPDVCHDVIDLRESQGVVDNGILNFNKAG